MPVKRQLPPKIERKRTTNLVQKQLRDSLLLDLDQILAEDLFSRFSLFRVKTFAKCLYRYPLGIPPIVVQDKFVLYRMIQESHVPVVDKSEVRQLRVFIIA